MQGYRFLFLRIVFEVESRAVDFRNDRESRKGRGSRGSVGGGGRQRRVSEARRSNMYESGEKSNPPRST